MSCSVVQCSVVVVVVVVAVVCLSVYLIYLSVYLFLYLSVCLSGRLSICKLENETILRDFLNFWTRQHQKRNSFCETSSIFEVDNIKNETILRDFLQTWEVECKADGLVPMRFTFFHSTCLKYCTCREKVMPGHTGYCTCHAKSSSQNWRSDAPKCNCSQEISARTS